MKERVQQVIDEHASELVALSDFIHDHPETGGQEHEAMKALTGFLAKNGFGIATGTAGLPTAFTATRGVAGPRIGFLAEYDALPDLGHACGHNLMAVMAAGAGLGAAAVVEEAGGTAIVFGTPDEENEGGKIVMANAGVFDGLAAALIIHPGSRNRIYHPTLACVGFTARFHGRPAHAAAIPHLGINALDGLLLSFNNINALRQHLRDDARVHGIITRGGSAANIVPDYAEGQFIIRARDIEYLGDMRGRIENCFKAGALASGARLEIEWQQTFADMIENEPLAEAFRRSYQQLGLAITERTDHDGIGSSDVGNVSHVAPTVQPVIAIAPDEVLGHSPEFAAAAASPEGHRALLAGAKAMAMTAVDIWMDESLRSRIEAAHRAR